MLLALCPINPTIGDLAGNAALIASGIGAARAAGADLVVFPELALCGYPPRDLLLQHGFIEACCAWADRIGIEHTGSITAVFGTPLPVDPHQPRGPIANSLCAYRDGARIAFYDKRLLPTYDVFDEDRYFNGGLTPKVIDIRGVRVGLSICEDLWKGEDAGFAAHYADSPDPVAELVSAGAQLIVSPSASPFVMGKAHKHESIVRAHAANHGVPVASLNQRGGNDELLFDGHAFIADARGEIAAALPRWKGGMLLIDAGESGVRPAPGHAPSAEAKPDSYADLFEALRLGIADYLRKTGFTRALVGLSGGIDSALTAALAAAALGPGNVTGVLMPSRYSSGHSISDAEVLADRLGIRRITVPIEDGVGGLRRVIDPALGELGGTPLGHTLPDLAEENLQSRIRGTILMAISNRTGAMVLTTGNKSELAVGYCTLYGDMNGGLAVLSDVTKGHVYGLSEWINANFDSCGFTSAPIPRGSIDKAPSAELRPDQTDQDSLPPYPVLDAILAAYVERRMSAPEIVAATGADRSTVLRIIRMIDLAEYKRKQAAIGLKVTGVAFGSGRRYPIAQRWPGPT
ncbi:MAG: NAD+ synthase [Phycisphaerae bacterium]|nr:NAD+ synthase [Phycisphaerae bacterium]